MYLLAFLVSSAYLFSNAGKDAFAAGNVVSIASILVCIFLLRTIDLLILIILVALIFLSTVTGAAVPGYWVGFTYKILTFLPVIVLIRGASVEIIYRAIFASFLISTLAALTLLAFGFDDTRFIIYQDVIPRFAGLAIEPSSYAIGGLCVFIFYVLRYRSVSFWKILVFYLPMLSAVSGVVLLKIVVDALIKTKVKYLLVSASMFIPMFFILYAKTRAGDSIEVRLMLYRDILENQTANWFGTGFYMHEGAKGLPGLFRIYFELGPLLLIVMITFYLLIIVKHRLLQWSFLLVGITLPFLQEAYGSPLLWLVSGFCLLRGRSTMSR